MYLGYLGPSVYEPRHDKTNKMAVRPAKTQISLARNVYFQLLKYLRCCYFWLKKYLNGALFSSTENYIYIISGFRKYICGKGGRGGEAKPTTFGTIK